MAWTSPVSRATGYLVTAARWNQDVVDNMIDLDERLVGVAARFPVALSGGFDITAGMAQTRTLTEALTGFRYLQVLAGDSVQEVAESPLIPVALLPAHNVSNPVMYTTIDGRHLDRVNPATAALTEIGDLGISPGNDMGLGEHNGILYLLNWDGLLYRVNWTTGAAILVANTSLKSSGRGRAFTSHGGAAYISRGNDLYTVNVASGVPTLVWENATREFWGLASLNGVLYAVNGNDLFMVDPDARTMTEVGDTGVRDGVNGAGLAPYNGQLYWMHSTGKLFTLNTTTGAATLVADSGPSANRSSLAVVDAGAYIFAGRHLSLRRAANATQITVAPQRSGRVHGIVGIR